MATTPEGKVKADIKKLAARLNCWIYMPVSNGMGAATLDFHCAYRGRAFLIEAKAPGKRPTPRQRNTIAAAEARGVPSFVCDGNIEELESWILQLKPPAA